MPWQGDTIPRHPKGTQKDRNTTYTITTDHGGCMLKEQTSSQTHSSRQGTNDRKGVIDKDYRGQIKLLAINHANIEFLVQQGDLITQLILEQIKTPYTKTVPSLQSMQQGSKGFQSTGTSSKPAHGKRLFFKAKLKIRGRYIQTRLLLDCGATSPILREEYTKDYQTLTKQ